MFQKPTLDDLREAAHALGMNPSDSYLAAVEEISRKQAEGSAAIHPRRRFELPGHGFFHYMAAWDSAAG